MHELTPEIRSEISRLVAPDTEVYEHALQLHRQQTEAHGPAFRERLGVFQSDEYLEQCDKERPALKQQCKSMRRR